MKKLINKIFIKIKNLFIITFKLIKKRKIIFIVLLCIGLFVLGLVRDLNKNKEEDNKNYNSVITTYNTYIDKIDIKILGGVNKDYNGQIEKGLMLYKIIDLYCDGLTDNALIDDIDFSIIIDNDYELIIKETNQTFDNKFYIEDYSQGNKKEYRYNGRLDNKIIIYIVDEGISDEDYRLITKQNSENIESNNKLVNINTATLEELIEIGLGKSKSEKLIEYRKTNGKFTSIEDITKVSGIGNATYEKVKDKICAK